MMKAIQSLGSYLGQAFGARLHRLVFPLKTHECLDITPSEMERRFELLLQCGF